MAKNKISEWSSTPANNTDVGGIDIAEGCAPSGINNAIREVMAQIKDMQAGLDGDSLTLSGDLILTGGLTLDGSAGTSGQVLVSAGTGNTPTWGNAFVAGMIMLWSGSIASVPSGWALCNGSSGTPDLRNRFVVGAGSTYSVDGTGGSADAIVVAHTHTGTTSTAGAHSHNYYVSAFTTPTGAPTTSTYNGDPSRGIFETSTAGNHAHTFTTDSTGSSGTNANLPPYYALAYIMKL
jgi:microcystin-dependent protein